MFVDDLLLSTGLGDLRATARVAAVARAMSENPQAAMPAILTNPSKLTAAYRFVNREATTDLEILAGPAEATFRRCLQHFAVLILHDTTDFAFTDFGSERQYLAQLTTNRHGFYSHFSLAVSADNAREVLGILSHIAFVHTSQVSEEAAAWWQERGGLYEKESQRWLDAVENSERHFSSPLLPRRYHICDREADQWDLFSLLRDKQTGFVLRCNFRDRIAFPVGGARSTVEEILATQTQGAEFRTISVPVEAMGPDGKPLVKKKQKVKSSPVATPRRSARVFVRHTNVVLHATHTSKRATGDRETDHVTVSAVEVVEVDPPKGMMPATWILYCSDEVTGEADAWQIVDWYQARWVIEEFFKAIKTGVAYESRQNVTSHALLNMLAITAVVACDILSLRTYDRHQPDLPADTRFDEELIECARRLHPRLMPSERPTMKEFAAVVARMGGHIKQNGPPGWQVLYRGFIAILQHVQLLHQMGISVRDLPPKAEKVT